jgi:thiosulfate/3-mercaptopyruvate sulfurtransferase
VLDGGLGAAIAAGISTTSAPTEHATLPRYPSDRWMLPTVGIDEVDELRRNREWRVVDVRSASRFAGLEEPIDPVAGHIPGAINVEFSANLADGRFRTKDELRRLYEGHLAGIPSERVVVHCGSGVTACHTLLALQIAGLSGASLYVGSWSEWCRNPRP